MNLDVWQWMVPTYNGKYQFRSKPKKRFVSYADSNQGKIVGTWNVGSVNNLFLRDIYLIKGLQYNMINIRQLCDIYYFLQFGKCKCTITNTRKEINLGELESITPIPHMSIAWY